MRDASAQLIALLHGTNTYMMADLVTLSLVTGEVYRFTSADTDLVLGSDFFSCNGPIVSRDATKLKAGLEVDTLGVKLGFGDGPLLRNLLLPEYARFDDPLPPILDANTTHSFDPAQSYFGGGSLRCLSVTDGSTTVLRFASSANEYNLPLEGGGRSYIVSVYVMSDQPSAPGRINLRDSAGTYSTLENFVTASAANTWTRVSGIITLPDATSDAHLLLFHDAGNGVTMWFDGLMIEEANRYNTLAAASRAEQLYVGSGWWGEELASQVPPGVVNTADGIEVDTAGHAVMFATQMVPVEVSKTYRVRFVVEQLEDDLAGQSLIYAGVATMDANFQAITGGAGTHRYCAVAGTTITVADGVQVFEGTITGEGDTHGDFRPGTAYVRPMCIVNYQNGTGRARVRSLEIAELDTEPSKFVMPFGDVAPSPAAASNGAFDDARVLLQRVFMPSWGDTSPGAVDLFEGSVAAVDPSRYEVQLTVKSELDKLNVSMPPTVFLPGCANHVYDTNCGLVRSAWTVNGTVAAGSTKTLIQSGLTEASQYFDLGVLAITSGPAAGARRAVRAYANGDFTLSMPLPVTPNPGDNFVVYPGCYRTQAACIAKNNKDRFRGYPYVPAPEQAR